MKLHFLNIVILFSENGQNGPKIRQTIFLTFSSFLDLKKIIFRFRKRNKLCFRVLKQFGECSIFFSSFWFSRCYYLYKITQCPKLNLNFILKTQDWEFAHSLIVHWIICSNRSRQMSKCEPLDHINQDKCRLWANRSGRLWQMSECEWFAQVVHDKWANELFFLAHSLIRSQKQVICLNYFAKIIIFCVHFFRVFL